MCSIDLSPSAVVARIVLALAVLAGTAFSSPAQPDMISYLDKVAGSTPSCPSGSQFSQTPSDTADPAASTYASSDYSGFQCYEHVIAPWPVNEVHWWGAVEGGGTPCALYRIGFYEDNAGQPGTLVYQEDLTASLTATGREFTWTGVWSEYLHSVTLSAPVSMPTGWISIFSPTDTACTAAWITSPTGDQAAFVQSPPGSGAFGPVPSDLSLCLGAVLGPEQACATNTIYGQPPDSPLAAPPVWNSSIILSFLAFEYFSGLSETVTDVTWWGIESFWGPACERQNTDFRITFFDDNAGEPGTVVSQETVTATRQATGRIQYYNGNPCPEYKYHATLAGPVSLVSGWLSVFGVNEITPCGFAWLESAVGGDNWTTMAETAFEALYSQFPGKNLSFCLDHADVLCEQTLSGGQQVPPNGSAAAGTATFRLVGPDTVELIVTHNVASPTAAYIHAAPPGVSGSAVLNLGAAASPIVASMSLADYELFSTGHYINVQSVTFPAGEIRTDLDCGPASEGEGEGEGGGTGCHTSDQNCDSQVGLSELLRVIQFFNSSGYHCDALGEDGFAPGPGDTSCAAHESDYSPQNWLISLSELLRLIQFFNSSGYHYCPGEGTEDGFCPGL